MASKRKRGDAWEFTFKKAGVLDKPLYLTFATESEGDAYARKLESLLDRGIVPTEHQTVSRIVNVSTLIRQYLREAHVKPKDQQVLCTVDKAVGKVPLALLDAHWPDVPIGACARSCC